MNKESHSKDAADVYNYGVLCNQQDCTLLRCKRHNPAFINVYDTLTIENKTQKTNNAEEMIYVNGRGQCFFQNPITRLMYSLDNACCGGCCMEEEHCILTNSTGKQITIVKIQE